MRRNFTFLSALAFVMMVALMLWAFVPHAQAKYGLVKWDYSVVDENGQPITDTITVNVYTASTTTSATVYSSEDAASQSNPWTETDGYIVFWSSATTLDIQVNVGARGAKITGVGADDTHRITLPKQPVGIQKTLVFTPGDFVLSDTDNVNTVSQLSASTTPGLEYDNYGLSIVWADGETTPVEVKFRVPYDYVSGGVFRAYMDTSTGDAKVDFQVYVNKDATAWDTAATNQTPVNIPGQASPEEVTLSVTTDFASLAVGDLITLQLWRSSDSTGTGDLELYYLEFYYNAKQ